MNNELISLLERKSQTEKNERKDIEPDKKCNATLKGIIGVSLWALSIAISKICVQILDHRVPHLQLNAWRFLISGGFMSIYLLRSKTLPWMAYDNIKPVGIYGVLDVFSALVKYIPVVYIALATTEVFYITCMILTSLFIFGILKRNTQELWHVSSI